MDQADIADQVITDNLERAIAAARGIRVDTARFSLSTLYCIECGTQIPEKEKQPFQVASVVSAVKKIMNCKTEGISN